MIALEWSKVRRIQTPRLISIEPISGNRYTFISFNDAQCLMKFGYTQQQIIDIHLHMRMPEQFQVLYNEDSPKHNWKVCSQHAFLYTLYRLHSTSVRQNLDSAEWGYDYSSLSKIFNYV